MCICIHTFFITMHELPLPIFFVYYVYTLLITIYELSLHHFCILPIHMCIHKGIYPFINVRTNISRLVDYKKIYLKKFALFWISYKVHTNIFFLLMIFSSYEGQYSIFKCISIIFLHIYIVVVIYYRNHT